jgi:hypothetical protein
MQLFQEFSIALAELKLWCPATGTQDLCTTLEQCVIYFEYPKMHLVSHILVSTQLMDFGDNSTTDISGHLHIGNVKMIYPSTKTVNCIQQMLKHNGRFTSLDNMEKTLSCLAIQGWNDIGTAIVFNLLSGADKQLNMYRVYIS